MANKNINAHKIAQQYFEMYNSYQRGFIKGVELKNEISDEDIEVIKELAEVSYTTTSSPKNNYFGIVDGYLYDYTKKDIKMNKKNQDLIYGGDLTDFPQDVVKWMLHEQFIQTEKTDLSVFERKRESSFDMRGFNWEHSFLGLDFCATVIAVKNFDFFYDKFPNGFSVEDYEILKNGGKIEKKYKKENQLSKDNQAVLLKNFQEKMLELINSKGEDYAVELDRNKNFKLVAEITGLAPQKVVEVFLATKVVRLCNLTEKEKTPNNESVFDTLIDLANYSFIHSTLD